MVYDSTKHNKSYSCHYLLAGTTHTFLTTTHGLDFTLLEWKDGKEIMSMVGKQGEWMSRKGRWVGRELPNVQQCCSVFVRVSQDSSRRDSYTNKIDLLFVYHPVRSVVDCCLWWLCGCLCVCCIVGSDNAYHSTKQTCDRLWEGEKATFRIHNFLFVSETRCKREWCVESLILENKCYFTVPFTAKMTQNH